MDFKPIMYLKLILFVTSMTVFTGCNRKVENKLKYDFKFIGSPNYTPSKKYDLRQNELVLAFASDFHFDTINVKYNNIDTTNIISTSEVTGFAWNLTLGEILESKELVLTINKFETVKFDVNQENQLFLIELIDSTLHVNSLYYLPGFY